MASTAELNLVIGVVDKASAGLSKIGGSLGTIGKAVGGLAFGGAIVGAGALGAALASGIGDAREANLVMAQTQAVIESTGGAAGFSAEQIADMAGSLSAASGKSLFGDDDIQRGQNMLLTFTNITAKLPDTTQVMLDMAQALGTDAGGAAVQLGKALNNPIEGVSALTKVGVTFTKEQKEQIKAMQLAGDMAGAQAVILAELNKEFGGSAAAAAKADGGMAQFTDSMGELAESVGAQVLPALNGMMAWLNSPEIQAGIESLVDGLVNGLGAAFTWLSDTAIPAIVTPIMNAAHAFNLWSNFTGIAGGIQAALQSIGESVPFLEPLTTWLSDVLPGAISLAVTAFNLVRDSVLTFIAAYNGEWQNSDKILLINQAFGVLGQVLGGVVVPAIQSVITAFGEWVTAMGGVSGILTTVSAFVSDNLAAILSSLAAMLITVVVPAFVAWSVAAATAAVATITALAPVLLPIAAIGAAVGLLVTIWDRDWGGMRTTITTWWNTDVAPILLAVKAWLDEKIPAANLAMKTAWETAWTAIKTAIDTAWSWMQTNVFPLLIAAMKLVGTTIDTLKSDWDTAWTAIKNAISTAWTFMQTDVFPLINTAIDLVGTTISTLQSAWGTAWSAITGAVSAASSTISGIIEGIMNAIRTAIDAINELIRLISLIPGVELPPIPGGSESKSLPGATGEQPLTSQSLTPIPLGAGGGSLTTNNIVIYQLPGEDTRVLAGRVADEIDRRNRLARTR
jgi:phage-related protein